MKDINTTHQPGTGSGWPLGLALPIDVLRTVRIFNQSYYNFQKSGARVCKSIQLTSSQTEILMALSYAQRPLTLTEVSPFVGIETASISMALDRLEKRKLIQRRPSKTDRRNIFISLTPEGMKMVDILWARIFRLITYMFHKNLTDKERKQLMNILRKIRDADTNSLEPNQPVHKTRKSP
jgi:DNA-binding MarR family transcriptional regulator